MRLHGSKINEMEHQWKLRRIRRNRKWREQRKMQSMAKKIIKVLEVDEDLDGRSSPCSVISFSLSLDNRLEDSHEDSEWIRTAHIKNPVNEENRRSPLFTRRMRRRNELLDDINERGSKPRLPYDYSSESGCHPNTPRFSARERLEPRHIGMEPREFNVPLHLESAEMDRRHNLESSTNDIRQCVEAPMVIRTRESIGISIPPEQLAFHKRQQGYKPSSQDNPRFIREDYDFYNGNTFSNQFRPVQAPHCFRQSLYYPPGYSSLSNEGAVRQQRPRYPWLNTSPDRSDNHQGHSDRYFRRESLDYNMERFRRDKFLSHDQRPYTLSEYVCRKSFDHIGNNVRESGSELSFSSHEGSNYCDYRAETFEMNYDNRRDDERFYWSYSPDESCGPSFSQDRFSRSGPSLYPSRSSYPPHDSVMDTPHYKSGTEATMGNWDGPPSHKSNYSYQDR